MDLYPGLLAGNDRAIGIDNFDLNQISLRDRLIDALIFRRPHGHRAAAARRQSDRDILFVPIGNAA